MSAEQQPSVVQISKFTGFPEVLGGRVKTLHPKIHAGILARNDQMDELEGMGLAKILLVVVNLYPFADAVKSGADEELALENIDIGGHTLIRAAAKNYPNTLILTDPADYSRVEDIETLTTSERRTFAQKAFAHVAEYDISISQYFGDQTVRKYYPLLNLKYGCNPHQDHASLCGINTADLPIQILNGQLGYINVMDALLGYQLVREAATALGAPVAASYKHTSPAGVGVGRELSDVEATVFDVLHRPLTPVATAFVRARNCDPLSSFGDFLAISDTVDLCTAELIKREVSDGIIAPGYKDDALEVLKDKKGGKYTIIQLPRDWKAVESVEYREIGGLALAQAPNRVQTVATDLANVPTSKKYIPANAMEDLILANITLKYTQSNSVAYAFDGQVIGIGAGQQNRVDCVKLAGQKAQRWCARFTADAQCEQLRLKALGTKRAEQTNAMYSFLDSRRWEETSPALSLASDAFFPFPDSIHVASSFGVRYIIQPGGSLGDKTCVAACDGHGIAMAMSGKRMFLH